MQTALFDLTIVIILTTLLAFLARRLHLPLILAYILAGIFLSQLLMGFVGLADLQPTLKILSTLGVAFLLFLVGVEMNLTEVRQIGPTALLTGVGQVLFTFILGFLAARQLFGFSMIVSAYLAIGLSFSSTIIIIKLLSEKGDLSSLYGRISVGFLLVQDLIAILALIFLAAFASGAAPTTGSFFAVLVKGLILTGLALLASKFLAQKIFESFALNSELILLSSIAWALLWSVLASALGFSLEIGAFLAGLTLSSSFYNLQIVAKIKPLRDFLIIVFFISLGLSMNFTNFSSHLPAIVAFSLLVLIGNPLILLIIMGRLLGHRKHTSFMAGLTVSQISEFSLIVAAVGLNLGHLKPEEVALLTVVAVITITLSSYMIQEGDKLYHLLVPYLGVFENRSKVTCPQCCAKRCRRECQKSKVDESEVKLKNQVVLVGAHRMGIEFIKEFKRLGVSILVVDFDPVMVERLNENKDTWPHITAIYGDASDVEIFDELNLKEAKLVISTVPALEDNLLLLEKARMIKANLPIIVTAQQNWEARVLYEKGADFVILPQHLAGSAVAHLLEKHWPDLSLLEKTRRQHLELLLN